MDQARLLEICQNCVSFIQAANVLHVDVTDKVRNIFDDFFANGNVVFYHNGKEYNCPSMNQHEIDVAQFKGKIDAVKLYKQRTGLSLLESKCTVEHFMDKHGYSFKKTTY